MVSIFNENVKPQQQNCNHYSSSVGEQPSKSFNYIHQIGAGKAWSRPD
jgi:hypothetical protein